MTRANLNEMAAKAETKEELSAMIARAQKEALSYRPLRLASMLAYTAAQIVKDEPDQFVRLALSSIFNGLSKELMEGVTQHPNAVERPQ